MIEARVANCGTPDGERILLKIFFRTRGSEKILHHREKMESVRRLLLHKIAEELLNRNDIHAGVYAAELRGTVAVTCDACGIFRSDREKEERTKTGHFWAR